MLALHLSYVVSSVALCISTACLSLSAWQLHHDKPRFVYEIGIQLAMSVGLFIFSGLLLVFPFTGLEKGALQIILSLAGVFSVICQVGYLSLHCINRWLLAVVLVCCIATVVLTALMDTNSGNTTTPKIVLSVFVFAEWLFIDVVCLFVFLLRDNPGGPTVVRCHLLWNIGICSIVWLGALASLVLYLCDKVNFITSLWIDYVASLVPIMWVIFCRCASLKKARTSKRSKYQKSLLNTLAPQQSVNSSAGMDSTTTLVAP